MSKKSLFRYRNFSIFSLLFLSACIENAPMDSLSPAGPYARTIDDLFWLTFWIAVGVFFIVQGALVFAVFYFRDMPGKPEPKQIHGNNILELTWTIIPVLILAAIAVPTVRTVFDLAREPENALKVEVIGHQWWFEFTYHDEDGNEMFRTANEMHVPVGRAVNVSLQSNDVIHAFWVPALFGKKDMMPGHNNRLWFTPNAGTEGMHYGQCVEYCGDSHANMRFRIFVDSEEDYDQWVANQMSDASWSNDELVQAGRELFVAKGCNSCHQVAYSKDDAPDWLIPPTVAAIGPNLSHLASRTTIASALLDRDEASMREWLANPPAVKPGSRMPNLELTEGEITKLIAMLDSLE